MVSGQLSVVSNASPIETTRYQMDSSELRAGYEEMSRDAEREAEALEWCEALIGDALSDPDGENSRSLRSG